MTKKKSKKKDVSKDENNESDETVNDTSKQIAEENTIQEDQESVKRRRIQKWMLRLRSQSRAEFRIQ
mgnify:CR=1 FL=1